MKLSQILKMTVTLYGGPLDGRIFDVPHNDPDALPRTITTTLPCSHNRAHKNSYSLQIRCILDKRMHYCYRHFKVEGSPWPLSE